MKSEWIVIFNRVEARLFRAKDMRKLSTLKNPLGREKNRAFTTGRPFLGRNRDFSKSLTHNMSEEKSPHDEAAKKFARDICDYLKKHFEEHHYDRLQLVAEPRMRGWVKKNLDKVLKTRATWTSADLGKMSDHELKVHFLG